jgi:hypothetical protein
MTVEASDRAFSIVENRWAPTVSSGRDALGSLLYSFDLFGAAKRITNVRRRLCLGGLP